MLKLIQKIIVKIEDSPTNFLFWAASFLSLILGRLLVENWLANLQNRSGLFFFYEFTHTFLFFLLSYLLILTVFVIFLKVAWQKAANILLFGFLIIFTPPFIDSLLSGGQGFWSFYDFGSLRSLTQDFFHFFDDSPQMGITYGVRLEVIIVLALTFIYSYIKSSKDNFKFEILNFKIIPKFLNLINYIFIENLKLRKATRLPRNFSLKIENYKSIKFIKYLLYSLLITLATYIILFVLATFPSWIAILIQGFSKGFLTVNEITTAQMFLTPAKIFSQDIPDIISSLNIKMSLIYALLLTGTITSGFFFTARQKFLAFLKNFRLPQILYHEGLLVVGMGLALIFTQQTWEINFFDVISFLVLGVAIICAWLTSVIVNDFIDHKIDAISNNSRPLTTSAFTHKEYALLGSALLFTSILFSAIVSFKIAFLLSAYQALAWLYSGWPLRLKRFAVISTFVSAVASLMILFTGYVLISPGQNLQGLPFNLIFLLVLALTLSLPIKDFKDIAGDRADEVYTIPVLFGEQWGKIIVGSGIFFSYLLSILIFNEFRLFWWAVLCGGASFWILANAKNPASEKNRIYQLFNRITYRNIFWWLLCPVAVYGIILVKIIFL